MDSLMGNGDGLRLAASRLRRDADLVASMGYRVSAASERVAFTGPAADRLHSDALSWRSTTNGVAQQLMSVAEMLDRAAQELEAPGFGGSAVGLAAWGSGSSIQATVGSGDVSQGFTSSAFGGDVGSADSGYVTTIGGYNPLPTDDTSGTGYVTVIGGQNPLAIDDSSGTGYVTTIGGYNPIPSIGTASGTGYVTVIGGQNPLDLTIGTGAVVPMPGFNPFPTDSPGDAGTGNIAVIPGHDLYGEVFFPGVGYVPVDMPLPANPSFTYNPFIGFTASNPDAASGELIGGVYNNDVITRILTYAMPRFTSPSSPF
jgi:hypothetical protein